MTTFSKKEIEELVRLHREELGLDVSEEEACQYATQLVELFRVAYRDIPDTKSPP
ncbi:MAG: hypothetical protein WAV31_05845 [Candidatus Moraniibacteriota bacterium]